MSPLVQRERPNTERPSNPGGQHWGMLVFESLSAGVLALTLTLAVVMVLVSLFATFVWPLTFWDLAELGLERYAGWTNTMLWSVFAGGTLAGYWCFSGQAFKNRSKGNVKTARASNVRR